MKTILDELTNEAVKEIAAMAIDHLKDCEPNCYGCDLHNEIYNTDYFIIGRYEAEQWLTKNIGIFNAIDQIKEYEENNFGEINTDLSEAEHVCNMLVYIAGEEVLSNSKTLQDNWNNRLDEEVNKAIIKELEEVFN